MKRKEALKVIVEVLEVSRRYQAGITHDETKAEYILNALEDLGMLPPINEEKSFKVLDNGEITYGVYEWEKEDET
jgi:hypothetical protein